MEPTQTRKSVIIIIVAALIALLLAPVLFWLYRTLQVTPLSQLVRSDLPVIDLQLQFVTTEGKGISGDETRLGKGVAAVYAVQTELRPGVFDFFYPLPRLNLSTFYTLSRLVAENGWPLTPCAVSEAVLKALRLPNGPEGVGCSALLIHLASGRILETRGDQKAKYPPGSLLKIPYAAALKEALDEGLGEALAKSDTPHLLARRAGLNLDRYRFLLSPVPDAPLGQPVSPEEIAVATGKFWRRYLGERDPEGSFPLEASLPELACVLRASLLYRPEAFTGLSRNGFLEGSTLFSQPESDKRELSRLHALSKTGTVSDERGTPLVGHSMVAWPAEKPVFLALFRSIGRTGAGTLHEAVSLLHEWSVRHLVAFATVRVRLMSLTPRESWEIVDEPVILDLRRERTRAGEVMVHLMYPATEEIVSCEVFRNRLKLPSCPDFIRFDAATGDWVFSGTGEGHGEGLSMERARALAESGRSASAILSDAYGEK